MSWGCNPVIKWAGRPRGLRGAEAQNHLGDCQLDLFSCSLDKLENWQKKSSPALSRLVTCHVAQDASCREMQLLPTPLAPLPRDTGWDLGLLVSHISIVLPP